jgi:hypothetical protein
MQCISALPAGADTERRDARQAQSVLMHWPGGKQMPFTQQEDEQAVQPQLPHMPLLQQPPPGHRKGVLKQPVIGSQLSTVQASKSSHNRTPRVQRLVVRLQLSLVQTELSAQSAFVAQHSSIFVNWQRIPTQVLLVQAF